MKKFKTKEDCLKTIFKFDSFRENQGKAIDQILNKQDTLVLMSTGGGKSLIYQIPAFMSDGLTIVISPLIALMTDQVMSMKNKLDDSDKDTVELLNSFTTDATKIKIRENVLKNKVKLLYISPERLENKYFINDLKKVNISNIVIDEAHCISEWGRDFRPSYRKITKIIKELGNPTRIALTATAPQHVENDICNLLKIPHENIIKGSFFRPNLYFGAHFYETDSSKYSFLLNFANKLSAKTSGIIYVNTKKASEELADRLNNEDLNVTFCAYHAELSSKDRKIIQTAWQKDKVDVIIATSAFGMGIDKSDIRFVVYYDTPKTIESLYQGIGRAGRDGKSAQTILLNSPSDDGFNNWCFAQELDLELRENAESQYYLIQELFYDDDCLNKLILDALGEEKTDDCGRCNHCLSKGIITNDIEENILDHAFISFSNLNERGKYELAKNKLNKNKPVSIAAQKELNKIKNKKTENKIKNQQKIDEIKLDNETKDELNQFLIKSDEENKNLDSEYESIDFDKNFIF